MLSGRGWGCSSLIALRDHRRVRRQRAGVVGDQQRAAGGGHVLDALDLGPEPVAVEELVERPVHEALDALRAAPVGELALGLDAGEVLAQRRASAPAPRPSAGARAGSNVVRSDSATAAIVAGPREVYDPAPCAPRTRCGARSGEAMEREGVARFPGAEGRIPNFAGAKAAAERLARHVALDERPDDQGEPGLAADPCAPAGAGAGQDARDGGAAAARPAPVPAARPAPAVRRRSCARRPRSRAR